jgi:hypothetical protein
MSKKQVLYTINKLIKQYEKRSQKCSEVQVELNEKGPVLTEEFLQIEFVENEEMLMDEFISDLKEIKSEIENA